MSLPAATALLQSSASEFWLPKKMKDTIPLQDQRWIASTLWKNQRLRDDLKQMWYAACAKSDLQPSPQSRALLLPPAYGVDALPPWVQEGL